MMQDGKMMAGKKAAAMARKMKKKHKKMPMKEKGA